MDDPRQAERKVLTDIKAIVFDLDGTLYVSAGLGQEILFTAERYLAGLKAIPQEQAALLLKETRARLTAESGFDTPLTVACTELGGDIQALHRYFAQEIHPESFLKKDERVVTLLRILASSYDLFLYTNNNRKLSSEITSLLGVSRFFKSVFTIEDTWLPKPDRAALLKIYQDIGRRPQECLFVGDRYDVDLREPAQMGSSVFLAKRQEDLLALMAIVSSTDYVFV